MKVEQAASMRSTGNARFRAMVSPCGQVEGIEVYSNDDLAAGAARMWHDLSMVTAAWRVLDQLKKVGRVFISASPDTLNLAGGKFCRLVAGLAGQGVEVNVMLGQRHGIYDPQKLLQFVTASRPFAIRLGVALHGRAWDWAAMARTVGAAFVTVDERAEDLDDSVRQRLGALQVVGVGVTTKSALEALEQIGAAWCSGPAARARRRSTPTGRGVRASVVTVVAGAVLAACASAPVPVVPDGARRVPVNDPQRIQQLRTATSEQNVAVAERSVLMDEVGRLRRQVSDLQTAVKVLLMTPADPPAAPPVAAQAASGPSPVGRASAPAQATAPSAAKPGQPQAAPVTAPAPAPDQGKQSALAVEQTERGTVFRVFQASGEAKFAPAGDFAEELVAAAKKGQAIEVHGRTDSRWTTAANTRVAIARAVQARNWLVDQGVEAERIRARYSSAGNFLVDGDSDEAKALNRRVEIVIRTDQQKTAASKSTKRGA